MTYTSILQISDRLFQCPPLVTFWGALCDSHRETLSCSPAIWLCSRGSARENFPASTLYTLHHAASPRPIFT